MVRKFCVFLLISISFSEYSFGQKRDCYTDTYHQNEILSNPRRMEIMNQLEKHIHEFEKSVSIRNDVFVTIPVVVHIVYNDPSENISLDRINTQIDVLNKDFRRLNTDANNVWLQAADTNIEFCLATVDPSGKSTTGITRSYTTASSFASNGDLIKYTSKGGRDAWPSENYLNIWVGDITGTVLGYAQFPGGKPETDGVVIDYKVFGTGSDVTPGFHLGRTTTHEVGHWLNLKHIWGSSDCTTDDLVLDTPKSDAPNYGCAKGHWSCGSLDMIQNYMDYSDDACLNLFTAGQKTRMQSLFAAGGIRQSITKSNGCGIPDKENIYCGKISFQLQLDNYPQETSWDIKDSKGLVVLKSPKYISSQKNTFLKIDTCFIPGCYTFSIYDTYSDGICCKYGKGNYRIFESETLIGEGGAFGKSASHAFCIVNKSPTCTDGLKNGTETGIDCGGSTCAPCISCYDGIKNGDETGIDCGGSDCTSCFTCFDGVQNGNETGIDCGGSDCIACQTAPDPTDSSYVLPYASYFETGWDRWTGGSSDTERYSGDFSREGDYSIMIRDNSGDESAMTSPEIDLRNLSKVIIEFSFYSYSMEKGERFLLKYHDGIQWNTLKSYTSGTDFYNSTFYDVTFVLNATSYPLIQNGKFRFECVASTNADQIYIDAVKISGIPTGAKDNISFNQINSRAYYIGPLPIETIPNISIYPNPTDGNINIVSNVEIISLKIVDLTGKTVLNINVNKDNFTSDVNSLLSGFYLVNILTENGIISKSLIKK